MKLELIERTPPPVSRHGQLVNMTLENTTFLAFNLKMHPI